MEVEGIFDPEVVYLVTTWVGENEQKEPQLVAQVRVREEVPVPAVGGATHVVAYAEQSDMVTPGAFRATGVPEMGADGAVIAYDSVGMLSFRRPVRKHFEPLTSENFARLSDYMLKWEYYRDRLPTTAALQQFYRLQLELD